MLTTEAQQRLEIAFRDVLNHATEDDLREINARLSEMPDHSTDWDRVLAILLDDLPED